MACTKTNRERKILSHADAVGDGSIACKGHACAVPEVIRTEGIGSPVAATGRVAAARRTTRRSDIAPARASATGDPDVRGQCACARAVADSDDRHARRLRSSGRVA